MDSESRSSYVTSQPPSESGEMYMDNSLDEFPNSVRDEETMDSVYGNGENSNLSCDVFTTEKSEQGKLNFFFFKLEIYLRAFFILKDGYSIFLCCFYPCCFNNNIFDFRVIFVAFFPFFSSPEVSR